MNIFKHFLKINLKSKYVLLIFGLLATSATIYAASLVHVNLETESGTFSNNVSEVIDGGASNGKAIAFSASNADSKDKVGIELCTQPGGLEYKGDILPYLKSNTDVVVPPGRYSIGPLNQQGIGHKVNQARNTWVTVKAEMPGTVVVDGTANHSGVIFGGGPSAVSQKLILAGIHFTGTSVRFESTSDVSLWYTCHEYTPKQFHQNAMASAKRQGITIPATGPKDPHGDGGGIYALDPNGSQWKAIADGMGSYLPTGIRGDASYGASRNIRLFGVDVGPVADDGIYMAGTWEMIVQGARIHGVSELYWQQNSDGVSVDPGPVYGDQDDQFHSDGIQLGTYGWKPTIVDTWSEGRIMYNKAVHPSKTDWDLRVRRAWFGPTLLSGTDGASGVKKLTDNPAFTDWLKGDTAGPFPSQPAMVVASTTRYSNPIEQMSGEFTGITYISHQGTPVLRLVESKSVSASVYSKLMFGPVTTKTFGYGTKSLFLTEASKAISADSQNPANIWRLANPYNKLKDFEGLTKAGYRPE